MAEERRNQGKICQLQIWLMGSHNASCLLQNLLVIMIKNAGILQHFSTVISHKGRISVSSHLKSFRYPSIWNVVCQQHNVWSHHDSKIELSVCHAELLRSIIFHSTVVEILSAWSWKKKCLDAPTQAPLLALLPSLPSSTAGSRLPN